MRSCYRYLEIDFLRGIAIIGMVIFHFAFLLSFLGIFRVEYENGFFHILAISVEILFFSLVGISLVLSAKKYSNFLDYAKKQIRRVFHIAFCALLITFGSFLVTPEYTVRFGILHCISICILLLFPLVKYRFLHLLIALLSLQVFLFSFPRANFFGAYVLGFPSQIPTLDYFPLFPWIGFVSLGIFLGNFYVIYRKKIFGNEETAFSYLQKNIFFRGISFSGRHALLLYMVHIPILGGGLSLLLNIL